MDHEKKPGGKAGQKPRPSSGDLLSSAKVVADAAKASLRHEADKVDKGRVADAAADLLGAASRYGKLEEKSMGKYVDKAEGYLRGYHSSHSAHAGAAAAAAAATTATATTGYSSPSHGGEAAHSAAAAAGAGGGKSGYGEYVKIAQGLLNSHSGGGGGSDAGAGAGPGGQHSGGGGYGDYIKMAEGFLKKH